MPITADHRQRIMEKAMPLVMMRLQTEAAAAVLDAKHEIIVAEAAAADAQAVFETDPSGANRKAVRDAGAAIQFAQATHESASQAQQALAEPAAMFEALLDNTEILLDEAGLEEWCANEEIRLQEDQIPIMEEGITRARARLAKLKAEV